MLDLPDGSRESVVLTRNVGLRNPDMNYEISKETAECISFVKKEGDAFLERLGYRYDNGNYRILWKNEERIVLFCHAHFARVWLSYLLNISPLTMMTSFGYEHTGVTVLHFKNNEDGITAPKCLIYSDVSHLYAHGPDTIYNGELKI